MDETFLNYYNDELKFIREMSGEFARNFPKVAGRLALDPSGQEKCADPFVERMLEGVAFLTARVRLKQDSEFPTWTQAFFESVYPNFPNLLPSTGIVKITPKLSDGGLASGVHIERGTSFFSKLNPEDNTPCNFKTVQDVSLFPLEVASADYYDRTLDQLNIAAAHLKDVSAAIRIDFQSTVGPEDSRLPLNEFSLGDLDVYIRGTGSIPVRIFEYIFSKTTRILVRPARGDVDSAIVIPIENLSYVGLSNDEAVLPVDARVFEGYRLLREYFACPQRFRYFRLKDLGELTNEMEASGFEVLFLMSDTDDYIQKHLDTSNFDLFCVPVINLFEKQLDRIELGHNRHEYSVVADKTKPYDYEVYSIQSIKGIRAVSEGGDQLFHPFYRVVDSMRGISSFYTTRREVRLLSNAEERFGQKSSYLGSHLYVSLVDSRQNHIETNFRQLSVSALCTNRHLPLSMSRPEDSKSDFEVDYDLVEKICFIGSPTIPRNAQDQGTLLWRMVNQLHSNYHSIIGDGESGSGQGLRDVLMPFAESINLDFLKQVEALVKVESKPITRRFHTEGPASFVRGQEIRLTFDEQVFGDGGFFTLGLLISEFLRRYVMINAFVETVLVSKQRGEIIRWKPKTGRKAIL